MTISTELFLAILSMDAYNRGYGAGISDGINTGEGGEDLDGLGEAGSKIGSATVKAVDLPSGSQTAGFYAVAYTMGDDAPEGLAGKTVISYRGTDNTSLFSDPIAAGTDILQGWIARIGDGVRQPRAGLMAGVERGT